MPSNAEALVFGDIILVPFPFTNNKTSKQRPAVVISTARFNALGRDVIVMAVTSQLVGDTRADDVPILSWQTSGLLKPSAIKPVIATLEQGLIISRLGALDVADSKLLQSALAELLAQ